MISLFHNTVNPMVWRYREFFSFHNFVILLIVVRPVFCFRCFYVFGHFSILGNHAYGTKTMISLKYKDGAKFLYLKSAPGLSLLPEQRIGHSIKKFFFTMQSSLCGFLKITTSVRFVGRGSCKAKPSQNDCHPRRRMLRTRRRPDAKRIRFRICFSSRVPHTRHIIC